MGYHQINFQDIQSSIPRTLSVDQEYIQFDIISAHYFIYYVSFNKLCDLRLIFYSDMSIYKELFYIIINLIFHKSMVTIRNKTYKCFHAHKILI